MILHAKVPNLTQWPANPPVHKSEKVGGGGYSTPCPLFRRPWATVISNRVESGSDDPDYLGHLGHFLVGQVGLIRKLNYLDVTWV